MRARVKRNSLVLWRTYNRWQDDDGPLMSAAVAYYLGLSMFPMLLLIISGIGFFFRYTASGQNAEQEVLRIVAEQASPALERHVRGILAQIQDRSELGGRLGIIGVLLTGIAGFAAFERAFNHIWNVPPSDEKGILAAVRYTLIKRGVAFLMLLIVGLVAVIVFIAGMVLAAFEHFIHDRFGSAFLPGPVLRFFLSIFLNTLLFTLIYKLLPPARILWNEALRAGMFAACGWEVGRLILAKYVIGTEYTSAYGLVGSFLAVLLWCYYAVAIIFLGAEYLKEICEHCQRIKGQNSLPPAAKDVTSREGCESADETEPHQAPRDILHSADAPARHSPEDHDSQDPAPLSARRKPR
jgi:membrane protein